MDITMNVKVCAETDIGLKRDQNEDRYLIISRKTKDVDIQNYGMMFAIADGMGGHAGGEIASKMACQGLIDYYSQKKVDNQETSDFYRDRSRILRTVIHDTHMKICEYGEKNTKYKDMGTTLSVLVLINKKALIAHVGDSRIYRLRRSCLEQLTEDHTLAQIFMETGHLTPDEASTHPLRHVMTQVVGQQAEPVFNKIVKIRKGDIFVLCSDGLYDMVTDAEIRDVLLGKPALNDKCRRLVARALEKGGKDNVTVMVIQV
jgi:protein phosphatase